VLDNETKRRIDAARDTLVGKVPDPKSQVEQITIALIYKFMADMDNEAESIGGKRSFFAGDFEQYRWEKLMSPGMGGHDILNLYAEAIAKMNTNPGIPQLFRDIFKNAYLPYRDPETLRGFLKIINDFQYDHSERLGDAFEYLLSVLGSQGDAGQFRTPRHIINFMVDIIAPQKDEIILDPACGTAGFLISAWKHIWNTNAKDGKPGDALTPGERGKLARNIFGYDISPDMVRLSLVNMYLHDFKEPHIHEYDTLTSEERWNENADVIFANPPFMNPRGGIRPHNRFSIQAKRSEVLFVDYIAEHLSAEGRAAVIVPEGIIFQSGNAYKQLRKMLVENYVVAVVSLPAGAFNPYSGVKTSILFMDKPLAKKTKDILFVKIENDGYDLGAQRRPIDKNDLPETARQVKAYFDAVRSNAVQDMEFSADALAVGREQINEGVDWSLNSELYREVEDIRQSDWPMVKLSNICDFIRGVTFKKSDSESKKTSENLPILRAGNIGNRLNTEDDLIWVSKTLVSEEQLLQVGDIAICMSSGSPKVVGKTALLKNDWAGSVGAFCGIIRAKNQEQSKYLFLWFQSPSYFQWRDSQAKGASIQNLRFSEMGSIKIPLPPTHIQEKIVAEINGYQKIIDGARQVVENYTPHIAIDPAWPMVELGEVAAVSAGNSAPQDKNLFQGGTHPFCRTADVGKVHISSNFTEISDHLNEQGISGLRLSKKRTILFPKSGASTFLNHRVMLGRDSYVSSHLATINADKHKINEHFLFYLLCEVDAKNITAEQNYPSLRLSEIKNIRIPLPPLEIQQKIVAEIEEEEKLIDANKALIYLHEQKIKAKIAAVWGE